MSQPLQTKALGKLTVDPEKLAAADDRAGERVSGYTQDQREQLEREGRALIKNRGIINTEALCRA